MDGDDSTGNYNMYFYLNSINTIFMGIKLDALFGALNWKGEVNGKSNKFLF